MREEAYEDKSDIGTRLMQSYVDDPVQPGQENAAAAADTNGAAGSEGGSGAGSGLPQVA